MGDPAMHQETLNETDDICKIEPPIMIEERSDTEKIAEPEAAPFLIPETDITCEQY